MSLLLCFILGGLSTAQNQSGHDWRISGKVVNARTGQVVARCTVEIEPVSVPGPSSSMVTGDDGQFLFAALPLGKYRLTATGRGYLIQSYDEHDNLSTAIAVGPKLKSEGLIFNLMPQSILYGLISDEAGEPVRRAQIRLYADQDSLGMHTTEPRQMAVSDDRGVYEIATVLPGNYYLAVSAQPWYARGSMSNGSGQSTEPENEFNLAYPTTYFPDATDSDEATPIPVKGGERIEANLTLTAQHAVRVRISLPPGEHAGYGIAIEKSVFGHQESISSNMQIINGSVMEVDGVLPGRYEVTLTQSGENSQPTATHFTADIDGNTTDLNKEDAVAEVTVSGEIVFETKASSAGLALVSMHPRRDYFAPTNKAGEFTFKVPPGEYEVVGQIPQMYLTSISSPNAKVRGHMLQVKADTAPRLEIVAGSGYGRIDGVAELSGQPVGGMMVVLAPEDAGNNQILFRRDQSDSDGTFSLFNIVPGRYRLLALADAWEMEWSNPTVLDAFRKKSIPVQVRANDKLTQTVEVQSHF